MDLFAIDDSAQNKPTRPGMGAMLAVGGIHVPGDKVRHLEHALDDLCRGVGFPPGEEFKWSPGRNLWMQKHLVADARQQFFLDALSLAEDAEVTAIVAMVEKSKRPANSGAASPEEDVTLLFLERADNLLAPTGTHACVVFDRPGGKGRDDHAFLATCLDHMKAGTKYAGLKNLALALSTDSKLSRLVQLADVVTSCTTARVTGEYTYSPPVFDQGVLPLIRTEQGVKGGRGLKLHPDLRHGNLYHWLLGDTTYWKRGVGTSLPTREFNLYRDSADQ